MEETNENAMNYKEVPEALWEKSITINDLRKNGNNFGLDGHTFLGVKQ